MSRPRNPSSREIEADAEPLAATGARQHLVPQPAFPEEQQAGSGLDGHERLKLFRSIGPARWSGHHHRQARVLELDLPGALRDLDVNCAGNDAVRVDVRAVMPGAAQQVDPQAVELRLAGEI